MSDAIQARNGRLEIDQALQYAVTGAWEDLCTDRPLSIHVEYAYEPGTGVDHLSVWSVRVGGYQNLLCDYWTIASRVHRSGMRFEIGHGSAMLSQTLDFIMKNQILFTRPADACPEGLVQIRPPDAADRAEAATWLRTVGGLEAEASKPPSDHSQDEEAWSRMDAEGRSHEYAATLPDATGYSG